MRFRLLFSIVIVMLIVLVLRTYIARPYTPFVDAPELAAMLRQETPPLIVDTRTKEQFAKAHIPGSINVSKADFEAVLAEANPSTRVVVICPTGRESVELTRRLLSAGVDATYLRGGFAVWKGAVESSGTR